MTARKSRTIPANIWRTSPASSACSANHFPTSASRFCSTISRILRARSSSLENNVTGRNLHDGTTNLVIDLKKRQLSHEDKLNYELNLGARKFKCTTIPIIRKEYGVVGAICINVDANYLTEEVLSSSDKVINFFQTFCRTDMQLDENILSRDEYAKALKGKRHFKDNRFE